MHIQVDPSKISIGPAGNVIIDDRAVLAKVAEIPDGFGSTNQTCSNGNTACTNVVNCSNSTNDGVCHNQGQCVVSTVGPPPA
jgi:hypothetical protein